jgi:hypothetical protein
VDVKRRVATLLLTIALGAGGLASAYDGVPDPDNPTIKLPPSAQHHATEPDASPRTSLLDLSLFGVIALGVLGLFWIRRHTSEL